MKKVNEIIKIRLKIKKILEDLLGELLPLLEAGASWEVFKKINDNKKSKFKELKIFLFKTLIIRI